LHLGELSRTLTRATPDFHNFITRLSVVVFRNVATFEDRTMTQLFIQRRRAHRHTSVQTHVLLQRLGVPYEVERTVCSACGEVLGERPLRRAAA
jgi:hypothetical protein